MQNRINTIQLEPIDSEILSFDEYEKANKENIKRTEIVPCDPYSFNNYGGVKVFYKNPVWK